MLVPTVEQLTFSAASAVASAAGWELAEVRGTDSGEDPVVAWQVPAAGLRAESRVIIAGIEMPQLHDRGFLHEPATQAEVNRLGAAVDGRSDHVSTGIGVDKLIVSVSADADVQFYDGLLDELELTTRLEVCSATAAELETLLVEVGESLESHRGQHAYGLSPSPCGVTVALCVPSVSVDECEYQLPSVMETIDGLPEGVHYAVLG
jgi:hypothetical protein